VKAEEHVRHPGPVKASRFFCMSPNLVDHALGNSAAFLHRPIAGDSMLFNNFFHKYKSAILLKKFSL